MDKPTKEELIKKSEECIEIVKESKLPTWAKYAITALIGSAVAVACTFYLTSCTVSSDFANTMKQIQPYIIKVEESK